MPGEHRRKNAQSSDRLSLDLRSQASRSDRLGFQCQQIVHGPPKRGVACQSCGAEMLVRLSGLWSSGALASGPLSSGSLVAGTPGATPGISRDTIFPATMNDAA